MKIDLGFSMLGDESKSMQYIHIYRKDVVNRVKLNSALDDWTKKYLLNQLKKFPDEALGFFINNINQIVNSALKKRNSIKSRKKTENLEEQKLIKEQEAVKIQEDLNKIIKGPKRISLEKEMPNEFQEITDGES